MNIIYIRYKLNIIELKELRNEFPQYEIFTPEDIKESPLTMLKAKFWNFVEILFDHELNSSEACKAHRLRWIHSPSPHIHKISLSSKHHQQNMLITRIVEANSGTISEFALASIFHFAKNLNFWQKEEYQDKSKTKTKEIPLPWKLENRILLQIGLGETGSMIANKASALGLRVWGACPQRSFHPHCQKTYAFDSLNSLLPSADIVSICLPKEKQYKKWFHNNQLDLMKKDAILICFSPNNVLDEQALSQSMHKKNYRGVLIDSDKLPEKQSPLWEMQNIILSPNIAHQPPCEKHIAYSIFKYNLRQYVRGNIGDMKNVVGKRLDY